MGEKSTPTASDEVMMRLLSGKDELSAPEMEAIFEEVMARVSKDAGRPAPSRLSRWFLPVSGVFLLVAISVVSVQFGRRSSHFTSRGGGLTASFTPSCAGSALGECVVGEKMTFRLTSHSEWAYFAVVAQGPRGTVWYFPGGGRKTSLDVREALSDGVLEQGVMVGPEHASGAYELFGVFSESALDKDAVRAAVDGAAMTGRVFVVKRRIMVRGP